MNSTTIATPLPFPLPAPLPEGATIAPPCAQPMDGLHKTLYVAFIILAAALLVAINKIPPENYAPAAACAAPASK